jgi:Ca-activated chloride channel family protein
MNANDVAPSRLDKAKNEIINIIDQFKTDKLGIIIFNSEAVLSLPLTYDHDIVKNRILNLKTSDLNRGSTEINSLLELINIKFANPDPSQTRVCLLITDGEFFIETNKNHIKKLLSSNIHVVTLGVGTQLGGKIPVINGFKKDKNNNVITSYLNIKQIAELASITNGNYFILNNQKNEINSLSDYIKTLKSNQNYLNQTVTYNKFSYFILIGILLLCIDYLTTVNVLKL